MFFYVVSRTYAEIFSLLRICSGLLSNNFYPFEVVRRGSETQLQIKRVKM